VNLLRKPLARILCLWAGLGALPRFARAADLPPAFLRDLAARSIHHEIWPELRSYARNQADREWRGWAYFLAGYQEYNRQRYPEASQDLAQAAQSSFSLADYAVYYQATALRQLSRGQDAARVLEDFATRFPQSRLHIQALALRAGALLDSQHAQQAIDVLSSDPETPRHPSLELQLGRAYLQLHNSVRAADAFQSVYYGFPLSTEAKSAADQLAALRAELGTKFPEPALELRTARAQALFKAGRYQDALRDYDDLWSGESASAQVSNWQLASARCLVRLHRTADALQALFTHYASPDLEAQRLALLVQVHVQQKDELAITQVLAQLESSYASSSAYADALSAAGMFHYRQLNWREASRNYRRLWELFPGSDHLHDDGWRLAWCDYLLGDPASAEVIHGYLLLFPDSPRAPAALYWLGRIQEEQGALIEARALYSLLVERFVHTYYAPQAAARLGAIRTRQGSLAGQNDSASAPLTAALIPVMTAPAIPQGLGCPNTTRSAATRAAVIIKSLDLQDLEEEYLKAALAADRPPADLRLLLAGTYAAQDNPAGALFAALKAAPAYAQMEFSDLPEEVWNYLYPQSYTKLIAAQARLNNLDPYLVMGLIRQESAFNAKALSVANARGLMQVLPETAAHSSRPSRTRSAGRRLYDPDYNVRVGCAYLAELLKDFDGKPELALAAYNAGDFRVRDWVKTSSLQDSALFLESIPIPATRVYVELVLRDTEIYRQLLSGSPQFAHCSPAAVSAP